MQSASDLVRPRSMQTGSEILRPTPQMGYGNLEQQVTSEHSLTMMEPSQSAHSQSHSSGYQSGGSPFRSQNSLQTKKQDPFIAPTLPSKELVTKCQILHEMLNKRIEPNNCNVTAQNLDKFMGRAAYTNKFKGADSFFYCVSKYIPNMASTPDNQIMTSNARTLFGKFLNENREFAFVSIYIFYILLLA